ncbi:MAG: TolC family protein [Bacteroidota bacterium]
MLKSNKILLLFLGLFFVSKVNFSQSSISLKAAIDSALKNNLLLKNERLKTEYQKIIIKSSADIPQTMLIGEYGQINSVYTDNKFVIAQTLNFPSVYSKQKKAHKEEWKASVLNSYAKEIELKKNVSQAFYSLLVLKAKEKLLLTNDSLYIDFLQKIEQLFNKGQINALEKASAIAQRGQLHIQLIQLREEIDLQQIEFQLLINTTQLQLPNESELKPILISSFDSISIVQHPSIQLLEKQKQISLLEIKLQKSKLLPDLLFQYNNMSILGPGPDGILYTKTTRFKSVQAGIGIPLFYGAQNAKINAAQINQRISENNYQFEKQSLESELQKTIKKYKNCKEILKYYDDVALKNAADISNAANLEIADKKINYLELLMSINQNISVHSDYLNVIQSLNENAIWIKYYLAN